MGGLDEGLEKGVWVGKCIQEPRREWAERSDRMVGVPRNGLEHDRLLAHD